MTTQPDVERCPTCGSRVFIDDLHCLTCGAELVFEPHNGCFSLTAVPCWWRSYRQCNWAAGPADHGACAACSQICTTDKAAAREELTAVYCRAVRRTLRRLYEGFGVDPAQAHPPLRFVLDLSDDTNQVVIGHADGEVTLDVAEADVVHREVQRRALGEPYRTPLGHVRHETGHWLWEAGVAADPSRLDAFRSLFGDERFDYEAALAQHYQAPDDGLWQSAWVSHYAAAHPWEDFAESTAHVLHIDDVINTASIGRLVSIDEAAFANRYAAWTELVVELNEVTRAMGEDDLYPFAPPPAAVDKMRFVDDVLRHMGRATPW